jgi:hypothetical protein
MKNRKSFFILVAVMTLLTLSIPVLGVDGTGSIRIDPPLPTLTASPAEFEIWVQSGTANEPHIFLVITEACFLGLGADVTVSWDGTTLTIPEGDWVGPKSVNSEKYPPDTTNGAGYTVASLQDHLETDGPIYYVFKPILDGPLTSTKETITITLESTDPEMLVYILGKSSGSELFDMRVPPTIPGFVVPEIPLGTVVGLATMLAALAIFAKKQPLILPQ